MMRREVVRGGDGHTPPHPSARRHALRDTHQHGFLFHLEFRGNNYLLLIFPTAPGPAWEGGAARQSGGNYRTTRASRGRAASLPGAAEETEAVHIVA